jgi:hypothetical protein
VLGLILLSLLAMFGLFKNFLTQSIIIESCIVAEYSLQAKMELLQKVNNSQSKGFWQKIRSLL